MEIYFYDVNKRYIGHRTLREGETAPINATTVSVSLDDGQEAYFENGEWTVSELQTITVQRGEPTIEECIAEVKAIATGVSGDLMGYMDWYYMTHPDEA